MGEKKWVYLSLGWGTHDTLAVIGEGHGGGSSSHTFCVFNDFGCGTFHDSDARIGSTEINTYDVFRSGRFSRKGIREIKERKGNPFEKKDLHMEGRDLGPTRRLKTEESIGEGLDIF